MDIKQRTIDLCRAAQKKDEVYFLLSMGIVDPSMYGHFSDREIFIRITSETNATIHPYTISKQPLPASLVLNLYQQNIEASAFYSILLNLSNIIVGKRWELVPYISPLCESVDKNGNLKAQDPKTGNLIEWTASKLSNAGFDDLAKSLKDTHKLKPYRNAYAHSKFTVNQNGIKIGYFDLDNGKVVMKHEDISYQQMTNDIRKFLDFRQEVSSGLVEIINEYNETKKTIAVQRHNNLVQVEIEVNENGVFSLKCDGAIPLW